MRFVHCSMYNRMKKYFWIDEHIEKVGRYPQLVKIDVEDAEVTGFTGDARGAIRLQA